MTADPLHSYPARPTADQFRHDAQTLYGLLLHEAHIAAGNSLAGDSHSRDLFRGEQIAYENAALQVAAVLGIAS